MVKTIEQQLKSNNGYGNFSLSCARHTPNFVLQGFDAFKGQDCKSWFVTFIPTKPSGSRVTQSSFTVFNFKT